MKLRNEALCLWQRPRVGLRIDRRGNPQGALRLAQLLSSGGLAGRSSRGSSSSGRSTVPIPCCCAVCRVKSLLTQPASTQVWLWLEHMQQNGQQTRDVACLGIGPHWQSSVEILAVRLLGFYQHSSNGRSE